LIAPPQVHAAKGESASEEASPEAEAEKTEEKK
jgi:hypothetical protein